MTKKIISLQKSFIHGAYVSSESGKDFPTYNPATGELICNVQSAGEKEIEAAVQSAWESQKAWAETPVIERSRILHKAARLLRERNVELAELEVMDTGKPINEAESVDVLTGADAIEFYANAAVALAGDYNKTDSGFYYTRHAPFGVCAAIGAWNYPLQIACWKSAPALVTGNSLIFKPSEVTPLTANCLAEIYSEAGVPPGVFNVVHGDGTTGALLSSHPRIRKIAITGEVGTGKKVMTAAASNLKNISMELGGKSPIIVFADANLNEAVSGVMLGNFYTQGEVCSNGTRVFVEEKVYEAFLTLLKARTEKLRVGDPMDHATTIGAMIHQQHHDKVLNYIKQGIAEGARLICGGNDLKLEGRCAKGNFISPTIFADCTDEMTIVKEEIFGPVAAILPFKTETEAIKRANHCEFGLAAGVFTQELTKAHRVADQLEAGVCWINNYNLTPSGMPFGGFKQSGIGRENCATALTEYTQEKTVFVSTTPIDCPYE